MKLAIGRLHDDNILSTTTRIHFVYAFLLRFANSAEVLSNNSTNVHKKAQESNKLKDNSGTCGKPNHEL